VPDQVFSRGVVAVGYMAVVGGLALLVVAGSGSCEVSVDASEGGNTIADELPVGL
jgi:hypothetical protein